MRHTLLPLLALVLCVPAGGALAQEPNTDVPQTFWVELGGFRVQSDTRLRLSGSAPGDEVDFERELDLPGTTTQAYLEAFWRLGRRHQVSVNWSRVNRLGSSLVLDREIEWGDEVFRVGADVQGKTDSDFLSGVYRFALVKNDTLELGPAIGIGHIWITAGIRGEAAAGSADEAETIEVDVEEQVSSITGDIGGYFFWWPGTSWLVRGEARYIGVGLESADAGVTEARASVTWYPWRQFGVGLQYSYTDLHYGRQEGITGLGGAYRYDGVQLLVSAAF